MSVLADGRRLLARRPWLYWAAVAALALLVGVLVTRAVSEVDAARQSWGETRPVVVAVTDIEPGAALAGRTEVRALPLPMVPEHAISDHDPEARATQRIGRGEVVVTHDIVATRSPQAFIPEGWLAVPIAEPVRSGVGTGDRVSVASGGVLVATDALVVGTTDESVLVAMPSSEAAQVAQAAGSGDATVLVRRE